MEANDKYDSVAADQDLQSSAPPDQREVENLRQELENLKKECDSANDRVLRKQAEFENYKKRIDREKSEFMQFASADLMKELLNALDSFDLALRNAAGDPNTLRGFELIYKQLQDTMARFGMKPIEAKGKTFDPNFHQAVSTQTTDDVEDNTVIEELRKGYTLHGRLLRPAMVSVSIKENND
jgi:molecular chaperone GrpE